MFDEKIYVTLPRAVALLKKRGGRFVFSETQLRSMCRNGVIPSISVERGGVARPHSYLVCVEVLLEFFRNAERASTLEAFEQRMKRSGVLA